MTLRICLADAGRTYCRMRPEAVTPYLEAVTCDACLAALNLAIAAEVES